MQHGLGNGFIRSSWLNAIDEIVNDEPGASGASTRLSMGSASVCLLVVYVSVISRVLAASAYLMSTVGPNAEMDSMTPANRSASAWLTLYGESCPPVMRANNSA